MLVLQPLKQKIIGQLISWKPLATHIISIHSVTAPSRHDFPRVIGMKFPTMCLLNTKFGKHNSYPHDEESVVQHDKIAK